MKIAIQLNDTEVSVESKNSTLTDLFDNFVSICLWHGYTIEEIEKEAIKFTEITKKDHERTLSNARPLGL